MRPFLICLAASSVAVLPCLCMSVAAQSAPVLKVDAAASRHAIDPNIYGIVSYGLDAAFAKEIQLPNVRWGGDGTTRYNWQVDATNAGFDWYFMGGSNSTTSTPSGSADTMVRTFKAAGATSLITIPILPYLNKSSTLSCSFPVELYGPQQSTNPYDHPGGQTCGNSLTVNGDQLVDSNIPRNHIENSPTFQMRWVQHLATTFGTADRGGVGFYQLDNEPGGWSNTHRDVQPKAASSATVATLGQQYATAIKAADPAALVLGPSDFSLGGWIGEPEGQDGLFAGQYYLRQMAAAEAAGHRRLLDYFDEHYYFQFSNVQEQLASSRTLWDPTYDGGTWVEQYEFKAPMQLIPRFQSWIDQYYPGTKIAFSEYSIDSGNHAVTDAIAEADVLGIFGREGVGFANMWNSPLPTEPVAYAFRLYRNFDGNGGQFGTTSVQATSSDQGSLAVYAAQRFTDAALTIVVLNKSASALHAQLGLSNYAAALSAKVYQYSGTDLTRIRAQADVVLQDNSISYNYPAYSATVFVVSGALQTPAAPFRPCLRLRSSTPHKCGKLTKTRASLPTRTPQQQTAAEAMRQNATGGSLVSRLDEIEGEVSSPSAASLIR